MIGNGVSRRGFLGAGAVGTTALVTAGSWFWWDGGDATYRAMIGGAVPAVLNVKELAILGALAETVIAVAPGAPTAGEAETARRIDRELVFHKGSKLVSDVKASLIMLEHLPALDFLGTRFTALDAADKTHFLRNCETSSWSARVQAFTGLKFLILFFYYADSRTWRSVGYGGPQVAGKFFEGGNTIANLPPVAGAQARGA
ncbi:MAG: twin-arginine translocation signal domain-containing protein [Alphaproteobacteria bacterium]|nr:twin-arginine translocation signal domain-containing protein [Alphaproteobacteria bacterium]